LRIGGFVDMIASPDENSVSGLIKLSRDLQIPYFILGGGTNILFPDDGFKGLVITVKKIKSLIMNNENITVGAGFSLWSLVQESLKQGLSGIESLAGIPGTIGGAVFGNAGSFGTEMKDVVSSIEVINTKGETLLLSNQDIGFTYRGTSLGGSLFINKINLKLKRDERAQIHKKINHFMNKKKSHQPIDKASIGCVFKNPNGAFAGELIDRAGCKGMTEGGIMVSPLHANFFINIRKGTEREFLRLIERVREKVYEKFNIYLQLEIKHLSM